EASQALIEMMGQVSFSKTPDLSFSARDGEGIVPLPHDNDPMVIQVHIFSWDIKGYS
ncbi:hypothetical protein A2U01_0052360, partial [Trifolium medium]|nr:hypothetical protein [Trifolium medium]